ncbi:MAG: ABC transporter ATP-binding protein, partial [Streptococcus hyointestinalis]|nr:ABC transporter ATP-binding protein [Streptococcus hyointestinalis]
ATSSIDTRTEALIQAAFEKLMQGRTSFIIAHRLSTIETADIILVMVDGDIVEYGNHQALMDKKGMYYSMQMAQAT